MSSGTGTSDPGLAQAGNPAGTPVEGSAPDAASKTNPEWFQDPTGREIDGYRVLRLLGQGGMGRVYLAEQSSLRRLVALKLIKPESLTSTTALKRFQLEAEAIARINHPGIVQVFGVGRSGEVPYMALEYVPGRNLKDYLLKKGTLDEKDGISILLQVAKALDRANEAGVIHRDIKPENILIGQGFQAKVADFGLARFRDPENKTLHLTQEGLALGTPLYMSPEQVEGRPLDIRTDIYSLGVTAYHMLAGRPPYQGKNPLEVALSHLSAKTEPLETCRPDLSPGLVAVVRRMMAVKPEHRHQTPKDLISDLQRIASGLAPARDPSISWWATWVPRFLPWVALAGSAAIAFGLGRTIFPVPTLDRIELGRDLLIEEGVGAPTEKRGLVLLDAARDYLQGTGRGSPSTGMALCLDLGLLFLNQGQLDEAESFFRECENSQADTSFQALGKLGLGIVLALKNKPSESLAAFKELGKPELRDRVTSGILRLALERKTVGLPKKNAKNRDKPKADQGSMLRFWLGEAAYYNKRNGRGENEMPPFLRRMLPETPKSEKS